MLLTSNALAEPSELPPAFAYNYGETETAKSAAMAGAVHAVGNGTTAPFANPATMAATQVYHIEALGQFTPEAGRQLYGGAIVDSTRRLAGGVSVVGGFQDPDGIDRSSIDVRAALSFAISKRFAIGMTGRYLNLEQEGLGPLGQSRASGGLLDPDDEPSGRNPLINSISFDAGVLLRPIDELYIGAFGQNLTYPDNGILPTLVGGGIGFAADIFTVGVDALADLNSWGTETPRVMVGGSVLLAESFPIRAGYRYDDGAESHQVGAGLGYQDPRFAITAGVRRTVVGPSATNIVIGVALFLDSTGLVPVEPY